jgi:glycosyltransferase involved in cell wall biosynthesis
MPKILTHLGDETIEDFKEIRDMVKVNKSLLSNNYIKHNDFLRRLLVRWYDIKLLIKIKSRLKSNEAYVVVTNGAGVGMLLALVQAFLFWQKVPITMYSCLWYRYDNKLAHVIKKLQLKIALSRVQKCFVWSRSDIDDFSEIYGLPRSKFEFLPYHETLWEELFPISVKEKEYIFAGGTSGRDWNLLIDAAKSIDYNFCIATFDKEYLNNPNLPSNVKVCSVPQDMYRKLMAESKFVVLPIKSSLKHTFGHQTFLNVMAMGKVVIVSDKNSAKDYITHMHDGILAQGGDVEELISYINYLLANDAELKRIGKNAKNTVDTCGYTYKACMSKIYDISLREASRLLGD